jgi:hypothetical protein
MNDPEKLFRMYDKLEALLEAARRAAGPHLPRWRRLLGAYRAALLIREAEDLMDEISALQGVPRKPAIWLGMGRKGWLRTQFFFGVLNAISALYAIEDRRWISAAFSIACTLICASWRLPKAPPSSSDN